MYQVKIVKANQIEILEELINMWLRENININVVDIKTHTSVNNGASEYIAVLVYEQQI